MSSSYNNSRNVPYDDGAAWRRDDDDVGQVFSKIILAFYFNFVPSTRDVRDERLT